MANFAGSTLTTTKRFRRSLSLIAIPFFGLALLSCAPQGSGKTPPKVVNGVLDVSQWDFEKDGPVKLDGDWEFIPEGMLEGEAVWTTPASGDFVSVPWSEAHHKTRNDRDVDDSRWAQLRVRIMGPKPDLSVILQKRAKHSLLHKHSPF